MTIPELLSLSDSDLTVAFCRDVLGWTVVKVQNGRFEGFWKLEAPDWRPFEPRRTEAACWAALPPVAPEVWLAMADRLEHESGESCDLLWDLFYKLQKHKQGTGFMPLSEALKRAVMIASIFTHQPK